MKYTILFVMELDTVTTYSTVVDEKPDDVMALLPNDVVEEDVTHYYVIEGEIIEHEDFVH